MTGSHDTGEKKKSFPNAGMIQWVVQARLFSNAKTKHENRSVTGDESLRAFTLTPSDDLVASGWLV